MKLSAPPLPQVYLTHEVRLTALTSDRIRKVCPPRRLIEELPDRGAPTAGNPPMPPVPQGRVGEAAILQQAADSAGPRTLNRYAAPELFTLFLVNHISVGWKGRMNPAYGRSRTQPFELITIQFRFKVSI